MEALYPTISKRFASSLIDGFFLMILMIVAAVCLQEEHPAFRAARIAAFLLIILGYEPILTSRFYTLGQYLTGIRVRRQDRHEERIGIFASYVRYLVKGLLGFFSFFLIPYTKQRRAVHDWLAGSVMVNAADSPASSASPSLG
jgi:uncharacterized RDD family membrane protein YckC